MNVLLVVVALAAAGRGVWSPCGLSMLSTITPIGERGRGHRYGATAAWYVVGSTVGGLCLGVALAGGAVVVGDRWVVARLAVLVAALLAVASDVDRLAFALPIHRRQVNERWLDRYRPWVYGGGFGWQVGTGFATYIRTAANYLLVVLAVASGSPAWALVGGVVFGLVRGLAVLLTRRATTPAALTALHRRVAALDPGARRLVVGVEATVAVVAAATLGGALLVVALVTLAAVAIAAVAPRPTYSVSSR